MTSKTETAILALVAALQSAAAGSAGKLPAPTRNEDLLTRLVEISGGAGGLVAYLNVVDGDRSPDSDEMLGADIGAADGYDIRWQPRIEFAVAGGAAVDREAAFDTGRKLIWDGIKPAVSGGSVVYLGGAVDAIRLVDVLSHENTTAAGLPDVKACDFRIELLFTSPDPF